MAKAKKAAKPKAVKAQLLPAVPPDDDDDDDLPASDELGEQDAEAELAEALAELGGISGATVTVNRVNEQGREEFCDRYPAREFDVLAVRERFGAGTYWIYGRDGKQLYKKGRVIFAQTLEERRGGTRGAASQGNLAPASDALASMREMFERQAQRDRELMQLVLQSLTANRPAGSDMQTVIDLASKMAGMQGKRDSGGGLEDQLRIHKLIRELAGESGGGESSGLVELGREFVRALQPASLPAPAPGEAAQPTGDQSQMMAMMIRRALAARLPTLITGAQRGSDPGVYAQLVLDQVPDLYIEALLGELRKPEWFNLLVQVDGRVVPLQPWFDQLRNEILRATSQDPPPAS